MPESPERSQKGSGIPLESTAGIPSVPAGDASFLRTGSGEGLGRGAKLGSIWLFGVFSPSFIAFWGAENDPVRDHCTSRCRVNMLLIIVFGQILANNNISPFFSENMVTAAGGNAVKSSIFDLGSAMFGPKNTIKLGKKRQKAK